MKIEYTAPFEVIKRSVPESWDFDKRCSICYNAINRNRTKQYYVANYKNYDGETVTKISHIGCYTTAERIFWNGVIK